MKFSRPNNPLHRIQTLLHRRRRARELGVPFWRSRHFDTPYFIAPSGLKVPISTPEEDGIKTAFMEIFLDDCYQLCRVAKNASRIIDVGANAGLFSVAARLAFPDAQIHAYEPNPAMHKHLCANRLKFDFRVAFSAIGVQAGRCNLNHTISSLLTETENDPNGAVEVVSLETALDVIGRPLDLLKLDCEGAEWDILQVPALLSDVNAITMEYHLRKSCDHDLATTLVRDAGFTIRTQYAAHGDAGMLFAERNL